MRRLWRRYPASIAVAAVLLTGGLAYSPSLGYPYLQDSIAAVARNGVVERGDLIEIFTSDYWKESRSDVHGLYRPVTVASFALERRAVGEANPFVSRLVNLFLHELAALVLFFYARRLGVQSSIALVSALLLTAHPLLLQGVVNVVGRSDILALLFSLLTLLLLSHAGAWGRRSAPPAAAQRLAAWGAAACLFFALGAKEIAIALPLLVLVQEALFRPPSGWVRRAAALAPCALAAVLWLALRIPAIGEFPGFSVIAPEDNVIVLLDLHGVARVATALGMAARYAGLLLFPAGLSADYSGTAIPAADSLFAAAPLFGLLFLSGLTSIALWPLLKRQGEMERILALSALLFLLPYLVVSNLLLLNAAGFAERLIYVPAAGFILLGVTLAHCASRSWPAARLPLLGLLIALLLVSVLHTREQAKMWRSARDLFERSLRNAPRSLRFNLALGHLHRSAGQLDQARRYFERNTEYTPQDPGSWSDLGILLTEAGDGARAEQALRTALRLDPQLGEAHAHLGKLLRRTGRPGEAERELRRGLLLRPDLVVSAVELGHLLFEAGRFREAAHYFRGCVRMGREDLREMLERAETLAVIPAPYFTRSR